MHCCVCGRNVKRVIKWYSIGNQRMYCGVGFCERHGYVKGKVKVRMTHDNLWYGIKILKLTDEEGAVQIRDRQIINREKRRERRHREMERRLKEAAESESETT